MQPIYLAVKIMCNEGLSKAKFKKEVVEQNICTVWDVFCSLKIMSVKPYAKKERDFYWTI